AEASPAAVAAGTERRRDARRRRAAVWRRPGPAGVLPASWSGGPAFLVRHAQQPGPPRRGPGAAGETGRYLGTAASAFPGALRPGCIAGPGQHGGTGGHPDPVERNRNGHRLPGSIAAARRPAARPAAEGTERGPGPESIGHRAEPAGGWGWPNG